MAGLGSSIYNDVNAGGTGGFTGGSSPPPVYIPGGQPGADTNYQAITNDMTGAGQNVARTVTPALFSATSNLTQNPYAGLMQGTANMASNYGLGTLAPQMAGGANTLFGPGNTGAPYAGQVLQTGFDPQNALYNRTYQQTVDQSNAINSMYGLGSSPAGAGLTEQATNNFNIDWQNAQLQRQQQATAAYNNLVQGTGKAYSGASDLGTAALGTQTTAGALPYQTYATGQNNNVAALNQLSTGANTAYGLDQNTLNALAAYLKLGQSATSVGQAGAAQNAGNMTALGSALGSGLQGLSGIFGGGGTGTQRFAANGGYLRQRAGEWQLQCGWLVCANLLRLRGLLRTVYGS